MRSRLRLKLFCVLVALIYTGSAPVAGAAVVSTGLAAVPILLLKF